MLKPRTKKPWNKGKIIGPKPALTPSQVQAIKIVLAEIAPLRDQLLFALAIDSCLRGCDLVRLTVSDLYLAGQPRDVVRIQPSKTAESTGGTIIFEMQATTTALLLEHIEAEGLGVAAPLFGRLQGTGPRSPISERAYLNLVKKWVSEIGLNPEIYGTHSIRRSRPAYIWSQTRDIRACQVLLGHKLITTTQRYLGVEEAEALEISRLYPM